MPYLIKPSRTLTVVIPVTPPQTARDRRTGSNGWQGKSRRKEYEQTPTPGAALGPAAPAAPIGKKTGSPSWTVHLPATAQPRPRSHRLKRLPGRVYATRRHRPPRPRFLTSAIDSRYPLPPSISLGETAVEFLAVESLGSFSYAQPVLAEPQVARVTPSAITRYTQPFPQPAHSLQSMSADHVRTDATNTDAADAAAVRPRPSGYLINPGVDRPSAGITQARRLIRQTDADPDNSIPVVISGQDGGKLDSVGVLLFILTGVLAGLAFYRFGEARATWQRRRVSRTTLRNQRNTAWRHTGTGALYFGGAVLLLVIVLTLFK
jgi:hypothetical protein